MRSDEREPERLIAAAFDRLPDPDSARLREIEQRLLRRANRRRGIGRPGLRFWWLMAALAATGAAAWWGGEYLARNVSPVTAEQPKPAETAAPIEKAQERPAQAVTPAAPSKGQREIYRREQY